MTPLPTCPFRWMCCRIRSRMCSTQGRGRHLDGHLLRHHHFGGRDHGAIEEIRSISGEAVLSPASMSAVTDTKNLVNQELVPTSPHRRGALLHRLGGDRRTPLSSGAVVHAEHRHGHHLQPGYEHHWRERSPSSPCPWWPSSPGMTMDYSIFLWGSYRSGETIAVKNEAMAHAHPPLPSHRSPAPL